MEVRSATRGVTDAELREAKRGFTLMLRRKRFSPEWIEENANDLLAQANNEYAEKLAKGLSADNPVGWLINCAWRRNQNLLDTRRRKPRPSSLEEAFHLADESTPTPEQQALDNDRQRRLSEALSHLAEKERKLLALVYFEDYSIREAGRKLGWRKSAADRHHSAAMEKMLALVGDRKLLSPAILGPVAQAVVTGEGQRALKGAWNAALNPLREGVALGTEAVEAGAHRLADVARRLAPFSEPGNAAASGGAGRVAGYCGAGVLAVVCGLGATGVVGPGVGAVIAHSHKPEKSRRVEQTVRQTSTSAPVARTPAVPPPQPSRPQRAESSKAKTAERAQPKQRQAQAASVPTATTKQTINEFGVERGSGSTSETSPAPQPSSESSPSPGSSRSSAPPPSSAPKQGSSSVASEFGM